MARKRPSVPFSHPCCGVGANLFYAQAPGLKFLNIFTVWRNTGILYTEPVLIYRYSSVVCQYAAKGNYTLTLLFTPLSIWCKNLIKIFLSSKFQKYLSSILVEIFLLYTVHRYVNCKESNIHCRYDTWVVGTNTGVCSTELAIKHIPVNGSEEDIKWTKSTNHDPLIIRKCIIKTVPHSFKLDLKKQT